MTDRLIIRDIGFIGPSKHATLPLQDGLNVLWGASNTGKSFFVKSMDFMFGAGSDRLPGIRERDGYDAVWVSLDLPKAGRVTLKRAIAGGDFAFFSGDVPFGSEQSPDYVLSSTHKESGSLSGFLLNEIGVSSSHKIAQDLYGGMKPAFSFRHFSPYIFTDETAMISEPCLSVFYPHLPLMGCCHVPE